MRPIPLPQVQKALEEGLPPRHLMKDRFLVQGLRDCLPSPSPKAIRPVNVENDNSLLQLFLGKVIVRQPAQMHQYL